MAVLRDQLNIGTQANLYNYVITDEAVVSVFGVSSWGDITPKYYRYDVTSTATDDGENVIKPNSVMGAGRYLKITYTQYTSELTNDSGFITGISSGDVNSALGYTPYNGSANPNGFLSSLSSKTTSDLAEGTNLYHTTARARSSVSSGQGIAYNSSTGVISTAKRQETYSGTTDGSGNYTVTFGTSYSVTPNIQANIIGGSNTEFIKITSISTTGFTVNVTNRVDTAGLLPSFSNVSSASVDVLITEK